MNRISNPTLTLAALFALTTPAQTQGLTESEK